MQATHPKQVQIISKKQDIQMQIHNRPKKQRFTEAKSNSNDISDNILNAHNINKIITQAQNFQFAPDIN